MVHIPSERVVQREMNGIVARLWYVSASGDKNTAILVKAPTLSIKAMISGCKVTLEFGKNTIDDKTYLCIGVRIFDIPDAPVFISYVQREVEEHQALVEVLRLRQSPIFLFNEMNLCVAWSDAEISGTDSTRVMVLMGDPHNLYMGDSTPSVALCLDCFCISIDDTAKYEGAYPIETVSISPVFSGWNSVKHVFYGFREINKFSIQEEDEGKALEKEIWFSLESVFPLTLHKNPEVMIGTKKRELTDIFSYQDSRSFLIETKALALLETGTDIPQEKRVKRVHAHARKAIGQLVGAVKAFIRNDPIYTMKGKRLDVDRSKPPHCIVLVTELIHSSDWSEIAEQLRKATEKTGAFFHLLDYRELLTLLKQSGTSDRLHHHLVGRWKLFIQTRNVHIRSESVTAA